MSTEDEIRHARDLEWANALWPEGDRNAWIPPDIGGAWHSKQISILRSERDALKSELCAERSNNVAMRKACSDLKAEVGLLRGSYETAHANFMASQREVNHPNKLRVHGEKCGGDYAETGLEVGCACRLRASRDTLKAAARAFLDAWWAAESNRGCYSCSDAHDPRCCVTWKDPKPCNCGRDDLERTSEALRKALGEAE